MIRPNEEILFSRKREILLIHAPTCVNLKCIIQNTIRQTQKLYSVKRDIDYKGTAQDNFEGNGTALQLDCT